MKKVNEKDATSAAVTATATENVNTENVNNEANEVKLITIEPANLTYIDGKIKLPELKENEVLSLEKVTTIDYYTTEVIDGVDVPKFEKKLELKTVKATTEVEDLQTLGVKFYASFSFYEQINNKKLNGGKTFYLTSYEGFNMFASIEDIRKKYGLSLALNLKNNDLLNEYKRSIELYAKILGVDNYVCEFPTDLFNAESERVNKIEASKKTTTTETKKDMQKKLDSATAALQIAIDNFIKSGLAANEDEAKKMLGL